MVLPSFHGFISKPRPVTYLLDDNFTTDDASPVATPRTCEPIGTLVFTGESNFSISSGQLNISSPGAWNTAGFRDNSIRTRTAGRRVSFTFTVTDATNLKRGYFAWNSAAGINYDSPATWSFIAMSNGSTFDLWLMDTAANMYGPVVSALVINTEYKTVIIQRAAGYFVYLKGGVYTDYTLVYIATTGTADAYAGFGNHSLVGKVNRMDIPDNLWKPTPRVSDSFDGRTGTNNGLYVSRYASNPVITVNPGNPNESLEQYVPAPVQMGNGDIWVYVKGAGTIYAWKSTDSGVTFSLQNSNNPVISPGTSGAWDDVYVLEPAAVYDAANNLIHLYYKGYDGSVWSIGHATAADSNPISFTKDAGNPVLSNANFKTALGLASTPTDLILCDAIKVGSTWYFYGAYQDGADSKYKIWYGTGTSWTDINPQATLFGPDAIGGDLVQTPTVFKFSGQSTYIMIFASGYVSAASPRRLRVATSSDGVAWTIQPDDVIGTESGATWENRWVYCASMLKESTSPFVAPIEISSKYLLYYSGYNNGTGKAQVGLLYLQDNGGNAVETNFPVSNAVYFGVSDGAGDPDGGSGGSGVTYDGSVNGMWELSPTVLHPAGETPSAGAGGWMATYEGGSADGVAIAKVVVGTASTAGFVFRYTDNNNFWLVTISDAGNKISIFEMNAGSITERANTGVVINPATEYTIVAVLSGQTITAYVNNTTKVTYGSATLNQTEQTHGFRGAGTSDEIRSFAFYPLTETAEIG